VESECSDSTIYEHTRKGQELWKTKLLTISLRVTMLLFASVYLNVNVWDSEEAPEILRFIMDTGDDLPRHGSELFHINEKPIFLSREFPKGSDTTIYQDHRGYPSLWTEDFRLMFELHEMLPLPVTEEKRVEVWEETYERTFERGICQFIEIFPKDCRCPTLHIDSCEVGLLARLARPDLTRLRV
jgi:hypothetical protein